LAKLTRLPLRFFEVKMIGDTLQRSATINDLKLPDLFVSVFA
jgi:hypothetical protein